MAAVTSAKLALVLIFALEVITAAPIPRQFNTGSDGNDFPVKNTFGDERLEHHMAKRATDTSDQSISSMLRDGGMAALHDTGKILQTAAMLPAETLQLVRQLTVPVLDAALSLPANALEGAASMTFRGFDGARATARTSANSLLNFLASLKHFKQSLLPHIGIKKDFTLGPLSIHKTFEIGLPKKAVIAPPPYPAEVHTTPLPVAVIPVTEAPKVDVVVPATSPAPVIEVPVVVTAAPVEPPSPLPLTTPPPAIVVVPAVPVAPVPAVVAPVAPVPAVVAPVAPVPAVVAPVAPVPAVVVPPKITDGDQVQVANVVKN